MAIVDTILSPLRTAQAALWTEAVPEQQRLTIQLARNSLYFVTSFVLIRLFGEHVAV